MYGLATLLLNLYSYIIIFLTLILIIFYSNLTKYTSTSRLVDLASDRYSLNMLILAMLSLAGTPPLLSFNAKLIGMIYLVKTSQYILLGAVIFINMYSMFFYFLNVKFLVKSRIIYKNIFYKSYILKSKAIIASLNFLAFINIFNIIFLKDIIIICNLIASYCVL